MKLENLNFKTWEKNHDENHDAKWFRELYPYDVFSMIDFDKGLEKKEQRIFFNYNSYSVVINDIELQENEKYKATFELNTNFLPKAQSWKKGNWNNEFQIIYTQDYKFITVYSKRKDPSKDLLNRFMKGNLSKVSKNRSLPISNLLFKSLLLHLAEENYPNGQYNMPFEFISKGVINLPEHPQYKRTTRPFSPFISVEREIWISYAFTEEKAHRLALFIANQAKNIVIVYCNPTNTKHHRCNYENTRIMSLYEFANMVSPEVRGKYENQIRCLQNHLHEPITHNLSEILSEINHPKQVEYEILKSELKESFGIFKILPSNDYDLFYCLSAMNLINAWISRQRTNNNSKKIEEKLKELYSFKSYVKDIISHIIVNPNLNARIYINKGLAYIELNDYPQLGAIFVP